MATATRNWFRSNTLVVQACRRSIPITVHRASQTQHNTVLMLTFATVTIQCKFDIWMPPAAQRTANAIRVDMAVLGRQTRAQGVARAL